MTKLSTSAMMFLSLAAFAVPEGATAGAVRDRAAARHMSARGAELVPARIPPVPRGGLDLGTETAIRIQDGHHGEGFN